MSQRMGRRGEAVKIRDDSLQPPPTSFENVFFVFRWKTLNIKKKVKTCLGEKWACLLLLVICSTPPF